jgi:hypothetical protein
VAKQWQATYYLLACLVIAIKVAKSYLRGIERGTTGLKSVKRRSRIGLINKEVGNMRSTIKDEYQTPFIKVECEYYQHRESLVMAQLKRICRNPKTGMVEYHLITQDNSEIQDDLFPLYWDSVSGEEYFA